MGYTTDFHGSFNLDKPLKKEHKNYLLKFAETRRMKRKSKIVETLPDPIREAVGLPIGEEGPSMLRDLPKDLEMMMAGQGFVTMKARK